MIFAQAGVQSRMRFDERRAMMLSLWRRQRQDYTDVVPHKNRTEQEHCVIDNDRDQIEDQIDFQDEADEAAFVEQGAARTRSQRCDALPDLLYRLKILHSNETIFGWFDAGAAKNYTFRTMPELEAALENPGMAAAETAAVETASASAALAIPDRAVVIAPTRYGRDICEVQGPILDTSVVNPDDVVLIEKPASLEELRTLKLNKGKEAEAYELCRQKIWARNLPMKLVSAHYMLDEPKILFYFSAESRVDFRELVKDLVAVFKMRIELRQIGVRDEARVTGGCGVCGRVLCCRGVSDKLNPVSIKMAKDQNLSLNSLKISGPCGRLLCCLSYEYQFYRDARREMPLEGARFSYDGAQFRVVEVNPLTNSVKMSGDDGRLLVMKSDQFRMVDGRWHIIG